MRDIKETQKIMYKANLKKHTNTCVSPTAVVDASWTMIELWISGLVVGSLLVPESNPAL
jgi:hypothetical protein